MMHNSFAIVRFWVLSLLHPLPLSGQKRKNSNAIHFSFDSDHPEPMATVRHDIIRSTERSVRSFIEKMVKKWINQHERTIETNKKRKVNKVNQ